MRRIIDELATTIYDIGKCMLTSFSYFMAGFISVSIPVFIFIWLIKFFT